MSGDGLDHVALVGKLTVLPVSDEGDLLGRSLKVVRRMPAELLRRDVRTTVGLGDNRRGWRSDANGYFRRRLRREQFRLVPGACSDVTVIFPAHAHCASRCACATKYITVVQAKHTGRGHQKDRASQPGYIAAEIATGHNLQYASLGASREKNQLAGLNLAAQVVYTDTTGYGMQP